MFSLICPVLLYMIVSLSTLYLSPMWSTVNGGLPLLALPFFRVVYTYQIMSTGTWVSCHSRPSRGVCEACLHQVHKPCASGAIPSQPHGNVWWWSLGHPKICTFFPDQSPLLTKWPPCPNKYSCQLTTNTHKWCPYPGVQMSKRGAWKKKKVRIWNSLPKIMWDVTSVCLSMETSSVCPWSHGWTVYIPNTIAQTVPPWEVRETSLFHNA